MSFNPNAAKYFDAQRPNREEAWFRWRLPILLCGGALLPALCGFVLERNVKARLPVTPEDPAVKFVWDGSAPPISDRASYRGGGYAGAGDTELMQVIIEQAMARWNSIPGSFLRLQLEQGVTSINREDGTNSIVVDNFGDKSSAAQAVPDIRSLDGGHSWTIADCDILVSPSQSSATSLERTITHELGHCIGLGHAHTNSKSLMGYARVGSSSSALSNEDMAGVVYLYPDPASSSTKERELISLEQCATLGGDKGRQGNAAAFGFLAFLAPLLLTAGSRAKTIRRFR